MDDAGGSGYGVVLAVGDPRRRAAGHAVFSTLRTSAAFVLLTVPAKQARVIYEHAPWMNDPYDTLCSFAMFFVPLVAAYVLLQVSLCVKADPVPIARVRSVLRGARVGAAVMATTLLSCWISVADGANRTEWTATATVPLVTGLALVTVLAASAVITVVRAPRLAAPPVAAGGKVDWLGDAVTVANRESRWFGPLRPAIRRLVNWSDRMIIQELRRHPVWAAVLASALFGTGAGINQGLREHYYPALTTLAVALLACGMFAFLMTAGSYLGVIRATSPVRGVPRRFLDACVVACAAAPTALAFRNSLWWMAGTTAANAGTSQLTLLIGIAMTLAFAATLGTESALRAHPRRA